MISIIIPTFNEEKFLPKLLDTLKVQTFQDFEIIVADCNSKDRTKEIAKKYGTRITSGGSPARGRNNGAKIARGDLLVFLDADVKLPRYFLEKAIDEMHERNLDVSTCPFKPLSNLFIDKVMHDFANLSVKVSQFYSPHAPGFCILIKKKIFERIHGFDEDLKIAEDHDLIVKASRISQFRLLHSTHVLVSVRRLKKEGRFVLIGKYFRVEFHRAFNGDLTKPLVNYEFGDFKERKANSRLMRIEKQIINLDKQFSILENKYFKTKSYLERLHKLRDNYDMLRKKLMAIYKNNLNNARNKLKNGNFFDKTS